MSHGTLSSLELILFIKCLPLWLSRFEWLKLRLLCLEELHLVQFRFECLESMYSLLELFLPHLTIEFKHCREYSKYHNYISSNFPYLILIYLLYLYNQCPRFPKHPSLERLLEFTYSLPFLWCSGLEFYLLYKLILDLSWFLVEKMITLSRLKHKLDRPHLAGELRRLKYFPLKPKRCLNNLLNFFVFLWTGHYERRRHVRWERPSKVLRLMPFSFERPLLEKKLISLLCPRFHEHMSKGLNKPFTTSGLMLSRHRCKTILCRLLDGHVYLLSLWLELENMYLLDHLPENLRELLFLFMTLILPHLR